MGYGASFGFVYKWTDNSNGKYYIGSHQGFPEDSNYIGSGIVFSRAYKKRPKAFNREILHLGFDYRQYEDYILNKLDAANDDDSYNLKNASIGGRIADEHYERYKREMTGKKRPAWIGERISEAKWQYQIHCSLNNKTYSNVKEAADHLNITQSYVRRMANGTCKNYYELKKIYK